MRYSGDDGSDTALLAAVRRAVVGHYEVERVLGRGGSASVFLARDIRHARPVAIKVMAPEAVTTGRTDRFLHEIRTAARLTHPHILGVHDSGESEGLLYYVMPFVEGESLRNQLARQGALPVTDAVRLLRELAGALAYAHTHGVLHRDLKPENILLSDGHAVIADFGIAKALSAATGDDAAAPSSTLTGTGMAIGTPAYMAPEQAVGDKHIDQRADLYALGVVAYEVLAGRHPFGDRTPQAHVVAHLTEAPAPLESLRRDVPPALNNLVLQLLAKDPAARPASAQIVLDALARVDGITASTTAEPIHTRRRIPARAWVALLLAVVAVSAVFAWQSRGSPDARRPASVIRSIAVLPFENVGGNQDDEYFSTGLTDELAYALKRRSGLTLAARSSSFAFKGKALPAEEIGRALHVDALISGTVRRGGDQLRISVQLVGTRDGTVLWDSLYTRPSRDLFAVQDEFTRGVAAALARSLGTAANTPALAEAPRGTANAAAYDLFLKGQGLYLARGADNVTRAMSYFQQAVALDPTFARAYSGVANAAAVLRNYVPDPGDSLATLTRVSALRAVALDSTIAEAQEALASVLEGDAQFLEAGPHFERALALDPSNPDIHLSYGFHLLMVGRSIDAERELREALRLDPMLKSARTALSLTLLFERRSADAKAEAERMIAADATFPFSYLVLALAHTLLGQPDSALATFARAEPVLRRSPFTVKLRLYLAAAAGQWADVTRVRATAVPSGAPTGAATDAAYAALLLGDAEPLIALLSTRAGQRQWLTTNWFGCNPMLDALWSDARFERAMRDIGVARCTLARPWPFTPPSRQQTRQPSRQPAR
jgi:serine/threonine-protein kinase